MKYCFLRFPGGKTKAVTLSYDDGCLTDKQFIETINKYGMKATFNIHASVFKSASQNNLTEADVREFILDGGHELAAHGAAHLAIGLAQSPVQRVREVFYGRRILEERFNTIIRGFAYPDAMRGISGDRYLEIRETLRSLGIAYARSAATDGGSFDIPDDFYIWVPTAHHDNKKLFEYIDNFLEIDVNKLYIASRSPKIFFIWGHTSEFRNKNNWERLTEICERLGGRDDIYYATNIEIYEYKKAFDSLIFSASSSRVYNPTLRKIWMMIDGKDYSIEPGETLTLG